VYVKKSTINAAMDYIKSEPLDERMLTVKDSGSTACPINVDHEGSANAVVNSSTEAVYDGSDPVSNGHGSSQRQAKHQIEGACES